MPEDAKSPAFPDPTELWKQWYETSASMWSRLMDGSAAKTQSTFPDPFTVFKQWYEATSGIWSRLADDVVANQEILRASSDFLDSYARLYRALRTGNEEYWHNLQLPTRSDIARVADLVVSLEEKVDSIDDALDDLSEQVKMDDGRVAIEKRIDRLEQRLEHVAKEQQSASAATVKEMQKRLDAVERKLDRVLEMLKTPGGAETPARRKVQKPVEAEA